MSQSSFSEINEGMILVLYFLLCFSNSVRFDGKTLMKPPKMYELPASTQRILMEKTRLDKLLYQTASERWNALVENEGPSFQEEVAAFRNISRILNENCKEHQNHPACLWYTIDDLSFYRLIRDTYAQPVDKSI